VRLWISGSGPTVVKLAGLAGGVGLYFEEMAAAAAAGFRVAGLDTAGDRADDPATGPLTWDALASEVVSGIEAIGAAPVLLWGTSFGSLVALAAAARRAERVRGLLLCHPPDPFERPWYQRAALRWVESRSDPPRAAASAFQLAFRLLVAWEGFYPTTLARLPKLVHAGVEAATPPTTVREKMRLLTSEPPAFPRPQDLPPTTIVASSWDTVAPPAATRRLLARLPGARLRMIRFAGHGAAYSRPRTYKRIIVEELARLGAAV